MSSVPRDNDLCPVSQKRDNRENTPNIINKTEDSSHLRMCAVKSRVNWDASTGWEMNMKDVNCLSLFLDHCFCYLRSLSLTMIFPLTVSVSSNLDKTYRHSTDLFIYCFLSIFHVNSIVTCDIHCIRTTIIDTSNIPTPACMMRFSALTMFLNEFPNLSSMKSSETRIRIRCNRPWKSECKKFDTDK